MIIFGWGHQTIKNIGLTFKNHCSHCNNEDYWVLTKYMTWFTLFFIPVIPYSSRYFLSCPVCQYGITLDNNQLEQVKPIAEANQLLIDGRVTEIEYKNKFEHLGVEVSAAANAIIEERPLSSLVEMNKFCSECGVKIVEDTKFCGNCGVKIFN